MARFWLFSLLLPFVTFCGGFVILDIDKDQASIGPGPGGLPLLVDTSEIMVSNRYIRVFPFQTFFKQENLSRTYKCLSLSSPSVTVIQLMQFSIAEEKITFHHFELMFFNISSNTGCWKGS